MVRVIVGVENETNRLIGGGFDAGQYLASSPREVRVDHQHVILKDHPGTVGWLALVGISLPEENAGRKFANPVRIGAYRPEKEK